MTRAVAQRGAPFVLMVASGFAGLGYQIVWTEQSGLFLGHESAAVLAVVAAFFGGLAVGAFLLGARIARTTRPATFYVACEVVIALWSLLLVGALPPIGAALSRLVGVHSSAVWQWTVAFGGTFVALLPATAAMGATLPAMERITARLAHDGRSLAALYASNTCGAVVGVLAAAFWLVPKLGLSRTAIVCVALNLLCAAAARYAFPRSIDVEAVASARAPAEASIALVRLASTGFLGIGYEVIVVRVLSQISENTVYTFALLLAVYLSGTATGAAAYQRFVPRRGEPEIGDRLFVALALACLGGAATLFVADRLRTFALHTLGGSFTAALVAEAIPAIAAFGPATIVMGALFAHLARRALATGVGFGRAIAVNTLGAAFAPIFFGVVAIPLIGPKIALVAIALGYLSLVLPRPRRWLPVGATLALVLVLAFVAPPLTFINVPDGGHVVSYREGVMAAVSVVEDADGVARLYIDNRQQEGSSATFRVDARQAWLPLLLHPRPRRALFLGLGTGVTAYAAAEDPTLAVDVVELLPDVIAASEHFRSAAGPSHATIVAADARRYVRAADAAYDVIVSDNFHPARSGSGALYTVEHFTAVRTRLAPEGLFCQWLPLHQLDLETLRSVVQSFVRVFPNAAALIASNSLETPVVGLVARRDAEPLALEAVRTRLANVGRAQSLGFEDEFALLGSFVAGPEALRRFAGDAPANTDDLPVVSYRAPQITYAPDSRPRDRLFALLGAVSVEPAEIVAAADPAFAPRLAAYFNARNRFITSGRDVRPSRHVEEMLAQVREPLLGVLRISADFRPAYDPLVAMARALVGSDIAGARALFAELARLQPARPEAPAALAALGVDPGSMAAATTAR